MKTIVMACALLAAVVPATSVLAQSTGVYQSLPGTTQSNVNGRNVAMVFHSQGSFVMQGVGWVEKNTAGQTTFRFEERQRDDWSVYLYDRSRDVHLQLDLHRKQILYNAGSDPKRPLYAITDARLRVVTGHPKPVRGAGVSFFQHCNYDGYSASLPAGRYTLAQLRARGLQNDDLSSVRVPSGWRVQAWEHDNFQGKTILYLQDMPCFTVSAFNDIISSIEVKRTGQGPQTPQPAKPNPPRPQRKSSVLQLAKNPMGVVQIEILPNQIKLTGPETDFIFSGVEDRRASDGPLTASAGLGVINGRPDIGTSFSLGAWKQDVSARFMSGAVLNTRVIDRRIVPPLPHPPRPEIVTNSGQATVTAKPRGPFSLQNIDTRAYLGTQGGQLANGTNPADQRTSWLLEAVGQQRPPQAVRVKAFSGGYLYLDGAVTRIGQINPNALAGQWIMKKVGDSFTLENAERRGNYLYSAPGAMPAVGMLPVGISATQWALAATPRVPPAAPQPVSTSAGSPVTLTFQNYSGIPIDLLVEVKPGDLGYVETLAPNQVIDLPSQAGVIWRFAQNDQWVGSIVTGAEAHQTIPLGR